MMAGVRQDQREETKNDRANQAGKKDDPPRPRAQDDLALAHVLIPVDRRSHVTLGVALLDEDKPCRRWIVPSMLKPTLTRSPFRHGSQLQR